MSKGLIALARRTMSPRVIEKLFGFTDIGSHATFLLYLHVIHGLRLHGIPIKRAYHHMWDSITTTVLCTSSVHARMLDTRPKQTPTPDKSNSNSTMNPSTSTEEPSPISSGTWRRRSQDMRASSRATPSYERSVVRHTRESASQHVRRRRRYPMAACKHCNDQSVVTLLELTADACDPVLRDHTPLAMTADEGCARIVDTLMFGWSSHEIECVWNLLSRTSTARSRLCLSNRSPGTGIQFCARHARITTWAPLFRFRRST